MLVQVVSDTHFEFDKINSNYEKMINTKSDILVLAGDIDVSVNIVSTLKKIKEDCYDKQVIYIPGNHCYYGASRKTLDKELMSVSGNNLHVLIEDTIAINDIIFIGSTGWWDGSSGPIGMNAIHGLNDFSMIYDIMSNNNGISWGQKAKSFIESKLCFYKHNFPDMKRVVITHHFPHRGSIDPRFKGSALNVCFYNAWEDLIQEYRPEFWIHGHTHTGWDYNVHSNWGNPQVPRDDKGYTRIICNPQGYPERIAVSKTEIKDFHEKFDIVATESAYNIYMVPENRKFNPCKVIKV